MARRLSIIRLSYEFGAGLPRCAPQRQCVAVASVGLSQPAVSQQLRLAPDLQQFDPATVLEAAAPVLKTLAA